MIKLSVPLILFLMREEKEQNNRFSAVSPAVQLASLRFGRAGPKEDFHLRKNITKHMLALILETTLPGLVKRMHVHKK